MTDETRAAFKKGEYTVATRCGRATVSVPKDITLGEIQRKLAVMFEGRKQCAMR